MTCPPFCDKCGGNLGHPANGDFTCAKCIGARSRKDNRKIRKERITKVEFHALGGFDNAQLFRLQSRGGAWRYYRRVELKLFDHQREAMDTIQQQPSRMLRVGVPRNTRTIVIDPLSEILK